MECHCSGAIVETFGFHINYRALGSRAKARWRLDHVRDNSDLFAGSEPRQAGGTRCCCFGQLTRVKRKKSKGGHDQQREGVRDVLAAAREKEDGSNQKCPDSANDRRGRTRAVTTEQNTGRKNESR